MIIKSFIRKIIERRKIKALKKSVINLKHDKFECGKARDIDYRNKGFSLTESTLYNFPKNDYRKYITTWEAYQPRIKNSQYSFLSDNKYLFSIVFGKYIRTAKVFALIRNGNVISTDNYDLSNENLYEFIFQNGGAVIKDTFGSDGFDVFVLRVKKDKLIYKDEDIDKNKLKKIVAKFKDAIIQEVIEQGTFENKIFPNSVNTVRVISMRKKGSDEHEIVAALQRIGNNRCAPVDNFNQGGGCALIDIHTGKLGKMTSAFSVDEAGNRKFYDVHPDTGAVINGTSIPNWNKLPSIIAYVTKMIPYFEYIAWDIVVQNEGFALIEINLKSSLNVFQIHGGMRDSFLGQKYREHGYLVE